MHVSDHLQIELRRFASLSRFNDEFETAYDVYFDAPIDAADQSIGMAEFSRFMDWFVFDHVQTDGTGIVATYATENADQLSPRERFLLRRWQGSYVTVFELVEDLGEIVRLFDPFQGNVVTISGRSFQRPLLPWSLIIGRRLPLYKGAVMAPGYTVMPPVAKSRLYPLMRTAYFRWRFKEDRHDPQNFLRENGHMFQQWLTQLQPWIRSVMAESSSVKRMVQYRATYRIFSRNKVAEILKGAPGVRAVNGDRLFVIPNYKGRVTGKTLQTQLFLSDRRLSVTCWYFEELQKTKVWLGRLLVDDVIHLLDVYEEQRLPSFLGSRRLPVGSEDLPLHRLRLSEALKQIAYTASKECGDDTYAMTSEEIRRVVCSMGMESMHYGLEGVPWQWDSPNQAMVASLVMADIEARFDDLDRPFIRKGFAELASALWWLFCLTEFPTVHRPRKWAAAVLYSMAYVANWNFTVEDCATAMDVGVASVGKKFRLIKNRLDLTVFDARYWPGNDWHEPGKGKSMDGDRSVRSV